MLEHESGSLLPSSSIASQDLSFSQILQTLSTLQGNTSSDPLDVMQREVAFLSTKVRQIGQLRRLKLSTLQKKLQQLQQQANEQLTSAQQYLSQVPKKLQHSQRQCSKRLEKLEKDRLLRDIEINSIIDDHIMNIAEQNQKDCIKDIGDNVRERFEELREKIRKVRKERNMEIRQMKAVLEKEKIGNKKNHIKETQDQQRALLRLQKKVDALEVEAANKFAQISSQRKRQQASMLADLQTLIQKLSS